VLTRRYCLRGCFRTIIGVHEQGDRISRIVIIAGPNGAGKTTFAQEYLPKETGFPDSINVDLIACPRFPFASLASFAVED
jgi:hypothetical protein